MAVTHNKHSTVILVGLFIINALSACSQETNEHGKKFNAELKAVVYSNKKSIYLKNLTNFEWERACVITPYMTPSDVRKD